MRDEVGFKLPLILAILLHVFVFAAIAQQKTQQIGQLNVSSIEATEVVQAVTVDQANVEAEMARIENEREQQRQAEIKRQAEQQQQAEQAEKKRQDAEQQLQQLQQQQQAQQQQAQQQLEQLKKQQQEQQRMKQQQQQALEKIRQQQQDEQQRLENLKQQKEQETQRLNQIEAQRKQAALEQAQRERQAAQQREHEQQQRQQQQIQVQVNHYKNLIVQAISNNWIIPENIDPTLSSQFEIHLDSNGSVLSVKLIRSSGDPALDRSAQTAIYRSSPLPVPSDSEAFKMFQVLNLTVRPEEVLGIRRS